MENNLTYPEFSHYPKGFMKGDKAVPNNYPCKNPWTIYDAYLHITQNGDAKRATEGMMALMNKRSDFDNPSKEEQDAELKFKMCNFETATFGGTFSYRKIDSLSVPNGFQTVDLDHLGGRDEVNRVKNILINDKFFVSALCFISPRQDGVKSIVLTPERFRDHAQADVFLNMRMYFQFEYGLIVDKSGSDISRMCFLPHDPECYINPLFTPKQYTLCKTKKEIYENCIS